MTPKKHLLTLTSSLIPLASFLLPTPASAQTATRPFMIVNSSMYTDLRSRSSQEPWASMKQSAITDCQNLSYLDSNNQPPQLRGKGYRIRDIAGACSLAYILDPNNQTSYRQKIIQTFDHAWPDIRAEQIAEPINYEYQPPVAAGFFHAILALDIIHNDLSSADRSRLENYLYDQFVYFSTRPIYYRFSPMGSAVASTWLVYKKYDTIPPHPSCDPSWECCTNLACWKNMYKNGIQSPITLDGMLTRLTSSGIYSEGGMYGFTAYSHIRDDRAHLMDVLEFTGEDNTYYTNPNLANLYEWLYGYASAPNHLIIPFGDSSDFQSTLDLAENISHHMESAQVLRASKFSQKAAAYVQWRIPGQKFPGRLLHYLLAPAQFPEPQSPVSRLFTDGGAFFIETNATTQSLSGALWNVSQSGASNAHKHKDVNSIYLSAYGEPLLLNVGFCGSPASCNGYPFETINNRAVVNNTALVNYVIGTPTTPSTQNDHISKSGGGIIQGFTHPVLGFDYAQGASGPALPNGQHLRSFIFVHSEPSLPGYFATVDAITPTDGSTQVHLAFHPHTDNIETLQESSLYQSRPGPTSKPNIVGNPTTGLQIFLATPPAGVSKVAGVLAHWADFNQHQSYVGQYLFNTYITQANQTKQIATLFFPFDAAHSVPSISRLQASGFTGAQINYPNNTTDVLIESNGTQSLSYSNIQFRARHLHLRYQTNLVHQFIHHAISFSSSLPGTVGISAGTPVTVFIKNLNGSIISPGTQVSFLMSGLTGITLNGNHLPTTPVTGGLQATIPQGTHSLQLISSTTPSLSLDNDTDIDIYDILILISRFTQNLVGDFNQNGRIDIFDFNTLLKNRL
jgi:hypothetical protein